MIEAAYMSCTRVTFVVAQFLCGVCVQAFHHILKQAEFIASLSLCSGVLVLELARVGCCLLARKKAAWTELQLGRWKRGTPNIQEI